MLRWHPNLPDDMGQQLLLCQPQICGHDCGCQWRRSLHGVAPVQGGLEETPWHMSAAVFLLLIKPFSDVLSVSDASWYDVFFFFFCSHVQKNENTASHHHTFSWIRKFDADFESFYTSLTLPLRSFHHIRSLLSAQSGQDVASAQLFCSHLWSTLDVWNPLYCILCAWKVENCTPYGHVYSQLMIWVCLSMLSFSHRVMHVPTGLWI